MPGRAKALSLAQWTAGLRDLLVDCDASDHRDQAACLRDAWKLIQKAPVICSQPSGSWPTATLLEAMIEVAAFESAALAMLPEGTGYMLSRAASGMSIASIVLAESAEDVTSTAATPALAILAALSLALLGNAELAEIQTPRRPRNQGARLN